MGENPQEQNDWDSGTPPAIWHAPCEDVTTFKKEFLWFQVVEGSNDRIRSEVPPQHLPTHAGPAMRVEVMHGDYAWNPWSMKEIPGGWRAEARAWTEHESDKVISYRWSTMLSPEYPQNPQVADPNAPPERQGKPIWQVITQWHQGDNDPGTFPPVAFIIEGDKIKLDLNRLKEGTSESEEAGEWPVCDLDPGEWHHFRADIRWHRSEGTVQVWHNEAPVEFDVNGEKVQQLTGRSTVYALENQSSTPEVYMKIGLYREAWMTESPGAFILYHDEVYREEVS